MHNVHNIMPYRYQMINNLTHPRRPLRDNFRFIKKNKLPYGVCARVYYVMRRVIKLFKYKKLMNPQK